MVTTIVRDGSNRMVGRLVESTRQIQAYNIKGDFVGYYDKMSDRTMTKNNALHSKGNSVRVLLF